MTESWVRRELISALKLNKRGVRSMTTAEQKTIPNNERSVGALFFNDTKKVLETYRSGNGNTFNVTEYANFIAGSRVKVGTTGVSKVLFKAEFAKQKAVSNNKLFVFVKARSNTTANRTLSCRAAGSTTVTETVSLQSGAGFTHERLELNISGLSNNTDIVFTAFGSNIDLEEIEVKGI